MKLSVLKTIFLIGIHMLMNFESGVYGIPAAGVEGVLPELLKDGGHVEWLKKGALLKDVLDMTKDEDNSMNMDHQEDGSMNMDHHKGGSMNMEEDRGSKVKHNKKSESCESESNGSNGLLLKLFLGSTDGSDFESQGCGCPKGKGHSKGHQSANDDNEHSGGHGADHGGHSGGKADKKGSKGGKKNGDKFSTGKYSEVGQEYTGNLPINGAPSGSLRRTLQEVNRRLAPVHHLQNQLGEKISPYGYSKVNPFLSNEHKRIVYDVNKITEPSDSVQGLPPILDTKQQ